MNKSSKEYHDEAFKGYMDDVWDTYDETIINDWPRIWKGIRERAVHNGDILLNNHEAQTMFKNTLCKEKDNNPCENIEKLMDLYEPSERTKFAICLRKDSKECEQIRSRDRF